MIEASHLRIGNVVTINAGNDYSIPKEHFVDAIDIDICRTDAKRFSPIPLTRPLLSRLGADDEYLTKRFELMDYHFIRTTGGWMQDFGSGVDGQPMNYLHELQNRIFSLTGKELTVKG